MGAEDKRTPPLELSAIQMPNEFEVQTVIGLLIFSASLKANNVTFRQWQLLGERLTDQLPNRTLNPDQFIDLVRQCIFQANEKLGELKENQIELDVNFPQILYAVIMSFFILRNPHMTTRFRTEVLEKSQSNA